MSLGQWRTDPAQHTLQIAVRNQSAQRVRFADVQLVTESFEVLPPQRVGSTLGRTLRTDFEVPYGRARCGPDEMSEVSPATVVAHVQVNDEPVREVRFAVPHPDQLLSELFGAECAEHVVRRSVDFAFDDELARRNGSLRGTLVVTRTGGREPVSLDEIGHTTHFRVYPTKAGRPVAVLAPGESELRIPIEVRPSRCDPHAFADAKQAFLFPVWVAVGNAEARYLRFTPPSALRAELFAFAREACGL